MKKIKLGRKRKHRHKNSMHNSTASAGAGAITACTAQARDQAQALWRHVKSAGARASEITQPQQKPSVPKPEEHKGQEQSASANASASAGTTFKNLPCSNFNCSFLFVSSQDPDFDVCIHQVLNSFRYFLLKFVFDGCAA